MARELSDETPGSAVAVPTDVTDAVQVRHLVDEAVSAFGRIDVILNHAGVMPLSPFDRYKDEEWDRMIDVNIKGVALWDRCGSSAYAGAEKWPHHRCGISRWTHVVSQSGVVRAISEGSAKK